MNAHSDTPSSFSKKLFVSFLSIIVTIPSCFVFLYCYGTVGSGLSNTKDKTTISYFITEIIVYCFGALLIATPILVLTGLYFYWQDKRKKFSLFALFSGPILGVLYFSFAIGALIIHAALKKSGIL